MRSSARASVCLSNSHIVKDIKRDGAARDREYVGAIPKPFEYVLGGQNYRQTRLLSVCVCVYVLRTRVFRNSL